ncbi:hypothetical protein [Pseudomonas kitaguniensis]|uniref:hypothetical protein n=1 Tax=Pseudomonas kitaguniensis TaxID=2607908 RepID=UPI003BA0E6D4
MSVINSIDQDTTSNCDRESWPRDFDFREQYAEQQELLKLQSDDASAPTHPKGENHA